MNARSTPSGNFGGPLYGALIARKTADNMTVPLGALWRMGRHKKTRLKINARFTQCERLV